MENTIMRTPQTEAIPSPDGTRQVKNNAGGYVFQVDCWTRLNRFLLLGSDQASYYASARKLTQENAKSVQACIAQDPDRTVATIAQISDEGRAPKNDAAIFALAMCLVSSDPATRATARRVISKVCRIPTHLFQLAHAYMALGGGWGRRTKGAFAAWYNDQPIDKLAYQSIKYQRREGWAHRDILRLAHPATPEAARQTLYRYLATGLEGIAQPRTLENSAPAQRAKVSGHKSYTDGKVTRTYPALDPASLPAIVHAFEALKADPAADQAIRQITQHNLPRECIPSELLNDAGVWEALLMAGKGMPLTAMIRNLGKMTAEGLLKPLSRAEAFVCARLGDAETLRAARVHPMTLLMALKVYAQGQGDRGSLTWSPSQAICDALDTAFYAAFSNVEPTNKRHLLALDVSGSMGWSAVPGTGLTPMAAAAAFSLITAKTEPRHHSMAFSHKLVDLPISPKMRLDAVVKAMEEVPMGATDCSLPMQYALKNNLEVDVFQIYTDNETWFGNIHPVQALQQYRQKMGIPAKLVVSAFTATEFSIADPNDGGMLDVCGLDSAVPQVVREFVVG